MTCDACDNNATHEIDEWFMCRACLAEQLRYVHNLTPAEMSSVYTGPLRWRRIGTDVWREYPSERHPMMRGGA